MRIIAGQWRGRPIQAPAGTETRPTSDRARETLFSMLASRIGSFDGLLVADLFAGSGALGLEALSRGAAGAIFVEQDAAALRSLRANIAAFRAQQQCDVRAGSVLTLGPAREVPDVIFLDPPYGTSAGVVALDRMARLGWLGPASWISLETAANEDVRCSALEIEAERKVGKAKLTLLRVPAAKD